MTTLPAVRGLLIAATLGIAALPALVRADSSRLLPGNMPAAYTQECAACHTAYPPGLLPARSWERLMSGLDKHYGTDASLDEASVREISGWLQGHAGTYKRVREEPPQDRITMSAWFVRKHRRLDAPVWKHASVKSAANCAACHTGADKGQYDDDSGLKFPAGLDERYRRKWSD
jgi:hypothetical protein